MSIYEIIRVGIDNGDLGRGAAQSVVLFLAVIGLTAWQFRQFLELLRIVSDLGWKDTMAGLVVPFAASATGAFLFRQHIANLPRDLSEAAQIDGASTCTSGRY